MGTVEAPEREALGRAAPSPELLVPPDPHPALTIEPDAWEADLAVLEVVIDAVCARASRAGATDTEPAALATAATRLRELTARLDAARLCVLPALEADGRWAVDGSRSFAHWLARRDDVALATARRDVRTARALRDTVPATRDAALAGELGADHVRTMVDVAATSDPRRQALTAVVDPASEPRTPDAAADDTAVDDAAADGVARVTVTGEQALLDVARKFSLTAFRRAVRYFAHVADPGADERGYTEATEREFFELSPTWGGYHLAGFLTTEHGRLLDEATRAVLGVPAAGDRRTATQRRAQALTDLAHLTLDHGLAGAGAAVRPHLVVHVSHAELHDLAAGDPRDRETGADDTGADDGTGAGIPGIPEGTGRTAHADVHRLLANIRAALDGPGPAHWQDDPDLFTPVPRPVLRRLLCDCEVTRVVFGPDSTVLDVGRTQRTVRGQLRRAVIARDRRCTYPGCDQPPSRCEVHHAKTHWADGGTTSVDNAALLCWHHHDLVDARSITMTWTTAGWIFTRQDGTAIGRPDPPASP
ncbi:DUF222 domain-containing protein [Luteimicrobium sp. DT211]|uniref:HNH endonuclease signature motif containing protein n=1 Tax=Luteimicrobium sp. DT211 TaxID=3393412 RepID=UPI003CEBB027